MRRSSNSRDLEQAFRLLFSLPLQLLALLWLAARAAATARCQAAVAESLPEAIPHAIPLIDVEPTADYPAGLLDACNPLPEIADRVQEPRYVRRGKRYILATADVQGETVYRKNGRRYAEVRS